MAVFRLVLRHRLFAVLTFTSVWLLSNDKKSTRKKNDDWDRQTGRQTDRQESESGKKAG